MLLLLRLFLNYWKLYFLIVLKWLFRCVHFGVEAGGGEWCSAADEACGGAILQATPAEQVREQLVRAAEVLSRAAAALVPARRRGERERARAAMVQHYHENKQAEHHRVLQRHKIIEERKEYIERLNTVREEEELRCVLLYISNIFKVLFNA